MKTTASLTLTGGPFALSGCGNLPLIIVELAVSPPPAQEPVRVTGKGLTEWCLDPLVPLGSEG